MSRTVHSDRHVAELFNHTSTSDQLEQLLDQLEEIHGEPKTPAFAGKTSDTDHQIGEVTDAASQTGETTDADPQTGEATDADHQTVEAARRSSPDLPGEVPNECEAEGPHRKPEHVGGASRERLISYPDLEGEDGSMVISWAGFDHLQRAKALATFYYEARNQRGWGPDRLVPILAGLKDLLPWVRSWHPEPDDRMGESFGEFLRNMIESQCQALGVAEVEGERSVGA